MGLDLLRELGDGEFHLLRGDIQQRLQKWDKALRDYATAEEMLPNNQEPLLRRAETLENMGDSEKALEAYARAIKLAPDNPVPYLLRAFLYDRKGDRARADSDRRFALRLRKRCGA